MNSAFITYQVLTYHAIIVMIAVINGSLWSGGINYRSITITVTICKDSHFKTSLL